jgi:YidC/Oxa1 family membrane protein insertase
MKAFWKNLIYKPILSLFIIILGIVPGGSLGLAIILITILVKIVLLPLSLKSSKNAVLMKRIQPKIDALKIKFTDKNIQAKELMALYKQEGVHPMSGCLPLLIQIPILIALYQVLGVSFVDGAIPFGLTAPQNINSIFIGIDLLSKSIPLAILVGAAQYFMAHITNNQMSTTGDDMQAQLARSMQVQMKYVLPVMMVFLAYATNGALSLYLLISTLLAILQEVLVRRYYATRI